jgi:hypothetical protein
MNQGVLSNVDLNYKIQVYFSTETFGAKIQILIPIPTVVTT